jgi:hypothetical protein
MNYKITCHLMPWELDYAILSFTQLKKSKYHLNNGDTVYVDVTLNLSSYLIDWESTKIPKDFFIDKFKSLQPLLNDYKCKFKIYDGNELYGGLNTMLESTECHIDYYMVLNPDMYFTEHLLSILIQSSKIIDDEFFIISPQIPKLWDDTWDVISNLNYNHILHKDYNKIDVYDVRNYMKDNDLEIELCPINTFKFAGWMDLYNKDTWENFIIQKGWNGYGGCDFYAMILSNFAKNKGVDIQQYIIKNQITTEYCYGSMNNTGYTGYYKKLIKLNDIPNQRKDFDSKMNGYINVGIQNLIDKKIIKTL